MLYIQLDSLLQWFPTYSRLLHLQSLFVIDHKPKRFVTTNLKMWFVFDKLIIYYM